MTALEVIPVAGLPEIAPGDDLAEMIAKQCELRSGDIVVVTQKIVSKAEGRLVPAEERNRAIADESARTLRRSEQLVIAQTRHGFVCASAGVDASNVEGDFVALLPLDPDLSARRLRARLEHLTKSTLGVVISDTFGRAWRLGQTDVAIGVAGFEPFIDYRGTRDQQGRELLATRIAVADELAGAAELVMGKADGIPVAIVRGAPVTFGAGSATQLVRSHEEDLFR